MPKKQEETKLSFFVTGHNKKQNEIIQKNCMSLKMAMMYAQTCIYAKIYQNEELIGEFKNGQLIS